MGERFQVATPEMNCFGNFTNWTQITFFSPIFELLGDPQRKYCVDQLHWKHHLNNHYENEMFQLFKAFWQDDSMIRTQLCFLRQNKNQIVFLMAKYDQSMIKTWHTIPTRRDRNLRTQLCGPNTSMICGFPVIENLLYFFNKFSVNPIFCIDPQLKPGIRG